MKSFKVSDDCIGIFKDMCPLVEHALAVRCNTKNDAQTDRIGPPSAAAAAAPSSEGAGAAPIEMHIFYCYTAL